MKALQTETVEQDQATNHARSTTQQTGSFGSVIPNKEEQERMNSIPLNSHNGNHVEPNYSEDTGDSKKTFLGEVSGNGPDALQTLDRWVVSKDESQDDKLTEDTLTPQEKDSIDKPKPPTQATVLYKLMKKHVDVFCDLDKTPYGTLLGNEYSGCFPLASSEFSDFMSKLYYDKKKSMVGGTPIKEVLSLLSYDARRRKREVFVRCGGYQDKIYIDLGKPDGSVVEVDEDGWRILPKSPISFIRPTGLLPLPMPERGGYLSDLAKFLNIENEDLPLICAWLVASMYPTGPFPVLSLVGEQGTAKSTTARALKGLIDPSVAGLRGQPSDVKELMIAAKNSQVLAFDNVSKISQSVSDALCRIATGGGYATRMLYTNADEYLFQVQRPVILTSITPVIQREDLQSRAITIELPVIPDGGRRSETQFWKEFNQEQPKIFGGLLDVLSTALKNLPDVELTTMPRMADFARFGVACAPALGVTPEHLLARYAENRRGATDLIVESSTVAGAVLKFMKDKEIWEGTATELLDCLSYVIPEDERNADDWPQSARTLSSRLTELAPVLRERGVHVDKFRTSGNRLLKLTSTSLQKG